MSNLWITQFKWHVGNKNVSNFNTISLTIWFGEARKNRLLKNCQNCSPGLLTALKKSWITQCWKGQCFWLLLAGGMVRAFGIVKCSPPGTDAAVKVLGVRLSEIRRRNLFSHSSSELRGHSWTLLNHFPLKECELINLGNSKVGRRHGNHYSVPFNWV